MVFHNTPSPKSREKVTGCTFTMKIDLQIIIAVTYDPTFTCPLYFPPYNSLILNVYDSVMDSYEEQEF